MKRILHAALTPDVTEREQRNRELSYRAACEGIVLLKNDGALPLADRRIALYGAGVTHTVKGGTGSGEVNERSSVTILEGMEQAGFTITSKAWLSDYRAAYDAAYQAFQKGYRKGKDKVNGLLRTFSPPMGREVTEEDIRLSACDTAVYVVSRQAGEAADRNLANGEFELQLDEVRSLERMVQGYRHTVLVINAGSYLDFGNMDSRVSAVIYLCQAGMEGGRAFADILTGKVNPSGKLTDSWARHYADVPCGESFSYLGPDPGKELYREGIYVGYRYYDTFRIPPRYAFGYGLSYTTFAIAPLRLERDGEGYALWASVKNTGAVAGKETVQLYASCPAGKLKKEYQRLVAFCKTALLAPGECVQVRLPFTGEQLMSFSEQEHAYVLEQGDYLLRLGNSSRDTVPAGILRAEQELVWERLPAICPRKESLELLEPANAAGEREPGEGNLPVLTLTAPVVHKATPLHLKEEEAKALTRTLTTRQKVDVVVGTGMGCQTDTSLVFAPGTVGRTTGKLVKKGIPNVNLADGPAGLRLLKESALSRLGGRLKFVNGNYMFSYMSLLPKSVLWFLEGNPQKDTVLYQYCTSFPVGTCLAQTWNTELCRQVGAAVSVEMQEYGITYWLAPAMNIHRNPLCGRNFEYFSEDPLLTGRIASALVRGVQSIPGNYATIKHFACNNQEDNRNHRDSVLSERALREIYLKGFETCVKEASPAAVMTSYNMVNGTYTPDSGDLCTQILREEWGFTGLVMTDWFSTMPGCGTADGAIAAGNDLIMPGTPLEKRAIRKAVQKGTLPMEQLDAACTNVLKEVLSSNSCREFRKEPAQAGDAVSLEAELAIRDIAALVSHHPEGQYMLMFRGHTSSATFDGVSTQYTASGEAYTSVAFWDGDTGNLFDISYREVPEKVWCDGTLMLKH